MSDQGENPDAKINPLLRMLLQPLILHAQTPRVGQNKAAKDPLWGLTGSPSRHEFAESST
jgi:hypothetical protein